MRVQFTLDTVALEERLMASAEANGFALENLGSPMFLCSREDFTGFVGSKKQLRMAAFYQWQRKRLGIMVDISHVSDEAFWDVMEITNAPAIASHSSARHFTPGWERNIADDMIVGLAENGGIVMINYGSAFLTEAANTYGDTRRAAYEAYLAENGLEDTGEQNDAFRERYAEEVPYPYATLDETLDHFDHVRDLVGVDHIGIGSDYDGVGGPLTCVPGTRTAHDWRRLPGGAGRPP